MIRSSQRSRLILLVAIGLLLGTGSGSCNRPEIADVADTIVVNARVATMDPTQRNVQAFAIRGDRIIAIGDAKTIRALLEQLPDADKPGRASKLVGPPDDVADLTHDEHGVFVNLVGKF